MSFFNYSFIITVSLLITGCNSIQTLSLKEAKEHTLQFKTSSFTPPKRTINDIKKLFDLKDMYINSTSKYYYYRPLQLAAEQFALGNYPYIIKLLAQAENQFPDQGMKVTKARYKINYNLVFISI